MAIFLIKPVASDTPDSPDKWQPMDFIGIRDDDAVLGNKEAPPNIYLLRVPGISAEDAKGYIEEWRHRVTYSVLNSNVSADRYRIRLESDRVSVSGKNGLTGATNFIERWGGNVVSANNTGIVFNITIFDAATSNAFWDRDVSGVVFVETSYNPETGDHQIEIQGAPYSEQQIRTAVDAVGGVFVAPSSFVVSRGTIRAAFQEDVRERVEASRFARRRWAISEAGVTALENAGGDLTVTPTQFLNNITDRLSE